MPLALSIFGVAAPAETATFCYAQLRTVGSERYFNPTLPKSASGKSLARFHPESRTFELHVWDTILGVKESQQVEAVLAHGSLSVPSTCPIDAGKMLTGALFAETLLLERQGRASVAGAG